MAKTKKHLPWRWLLVAASIAGLLYKWQLDKSVCENAWSGDLPGLTQSIDHGGDPDASWQGIYAMDAAFLYQHQACALFLLRHGANPNCIMPKIIYHIDPPTLAELVSRGLRVRGAWGDRALFIAIRAGRSDMVEALLRQGANFSARDAQTGDSLWEVAFKSDSLRHFQSPKVLLLLSECNAQISKGSHP